MKVINMDDGGFRLEYTTAEQWANLHESQHLRLRNQLAIMTGQVESALAKLKEGGDLRTIEFFLATAVNLAKDNIAENDRLTKLVEKQTGSTEFEHKYPNT